MKNNEPLNMIYDYDPDEYIETQIQLRTEYRVTKVISQIAISAALVLLFVSGYLGAIVLSNLVEVNNHQKIIQPGDINHSQVN